MSESMKTEQSLLEQMTIARERGEQLVAAPEPLPKLLSPAAIRGVSEGIRKDREAAHRLLAGARERVAKIERDPRLSSEAKAADRAAVEQAMLEAIRPRSSPSGALSGLSKHKSRTTVAR